MLLFCRNAVSLLLALAPPPPNEDEPLLLLERDSASLCQTTTTTIPSEGDILQRLVVNSNRASEERLDGPSDGCGDRRMILTHTRVARFMKYTREMSPKINRLVHLE